MKRPLALALLGAVAALVAVLLVLLPSPAPSLAAPPRDATTPDADEDSLSDLAEVARWGTDPLRADTDGDGLPDAWEVRHRAAFGVRSCPDPTVADGEADCIGKGMRLRDDHENGTDPSRADSDGDGLPDAYEASHGMDPATDDAQRDPFGDGLTNLQRWRLGARGDRPDSACSGISDARKVELGLDPSRASTGGSGVPDGYALHWGLDPRDPAIGALRLDGDADGLTVLEKALASFSLLGLCAPGADLARSLDPRASDGDGDGLPDAWELRYGLDPTDEEDGARPSSADPLLSNREIHELGACPDVPDCDEDGLTTREEAIDGWAVTVDGVSRFVRSNPLSAVTDGDRIPDGAKRAGRWEAGGRVYAFPSLDPATPDTDGDGLPDAEEILRFAGLLDATRRDADGDGLPDGEEVRYWDARAEDEPTSAGRLCATCAVLDGRPANVANPDSDEDGLLDGEEVRPSPWRVAPGERATAAFPASDPARADSDGDGLPDAWERRHAVLDEADAVWDLNPSQATSLPTGRGCGPKGTCLDGERDLDGDALPNAAEFATGTDPHQLDTDGDGLPDGWEHQHGRPSAARFGGAGPGGPGWSWLPREGDLSPLAPADPRDAATVIARWAPAEGSPREWTFLDAYRLGASPLAPSLAGDGLPDFWKALHAERAPEAFRVGADLDRADPDRDGLVNLDEFLTGTDPLAADTDGGGLGDGVEFASGLNPRLSDDDDPDGDLDGDGLTNDAERRVWRTGVANPDSDGDGLLDGSSRTAPPHLESAWLARGIAWRESNGSRLFLGEHEVSADPARGCARAWTCAGDGLPDAWKAYHGLPALAFHSPDTSLSADGLGVLAEYAWGRPGWWREAEDGTWWLGLDPMRADTNGDGVRDDRHTRVGDVADLDRDGLNDLAGEDPWPFHDALNLGTLDLHDRGAVFAALKTREASRGPSFPVSPQPVRFEIDGDMPSTIAKGGAVVLEGVLRGAPSGVPVVARLVPASATDAEAPFLRSPNASHAAGVTWTEAAGRFRITVSLVKDHAADPPPGTFALFGAPPPDHAEWVLATKDVPPGSSVRVLLASYAVPAEGGVVAAATLLSDPLAVTSEARFLLEGRPAARPGATAWLNVTLTDGAGDPHEPAEAGLLRAEVDGRPVLPAMDGARARFQLPVPPDAAPAPIPVEVTFLGDDRLAAGATQTEILPRLRTRLDATGPDEAVLGEAFRVEGRLLDELKRPVAGAEVLVRIGGSQAPGTTGSDGIFRASLPLAASVPLGALRPSVAYEGDDFRSAALASLPSVTVRASPAFSDVDVALVLGRPGVVRATLLAAATLPVDPVSGEAPQVTVTLGEARITVRPRANGSIEATIPAAELPAPGTALLVLRSAATPLVAAAEHQETVLVASATSLSIEAGDVLRGETARLAGSLRDARGEGLAGRTVLVRAGGLEIPARTAENGTFEVGLDTSRTDPPGIREVEAAFEGDVAVDPASARTRFTLRAAARVEPQPVREGDRTVRLRVLDDGGAPVPYASIEAGASARTAVADAGGATSLALDAPAKPGAPLRLDVTVSGNATRATTHAMLLLPVLRTTAIRVLEVPPDALRGDALTLRLRVEGTTGEPVAAAALDVELRESRAGTLRTNASGEAAGAIQVPHGAALGATTLSIRYPGGGEFAASSMDLPFRIRDAVRIELAVDARDGGVAIVARLSGTAGPLPGAWMSLEIPGYDDPLLVRTDAAGAVALGPLDVRADGPVIARFPGTASHRPATETIVSSAAVTVEAPPTLPWPYLSGIGALAAATAAAWLWRSGTRQRGQEAPGPFDVVAADPAVVVPFRALADIVARLRKEGHPVDSMTAREIGDLLVARGHPPEAVLRLVAAFERARYAPSPPSLDEIRDLPRLSRKVR